MAVVTHTVAVATTATALNDQTEIQGSADGSPGMAYNDGSVTVYVGGANVATSGATKGIPLLPSASITIDSRGDLLYGRVVSGTCNVIVLETGGA